MEYDKFIHMWLCFYKSKEKPCNVGRGKTPEESRMDLRRRVLEKVQVDWE